MSVVWSILALIIAGVVCYFIYEEYIVDKPEESEAEKEIEADLMALAAESGMPEFDSRPDSRKSGSVPEISADGAAIIGETEPTAEDASDDAPADAAPPAAVAVADVSVDSDVDNAAIAQDDSAEDAADDAVADDAVEEAAAPVNAVIVEEPAEEVVAVEEVAVEEDVVVAERTVAVPLEVDDLTKIKGIGKVYAQRLNEAGITSYQQIVNTDVATLEEISKAIPAANAYDWARQARKLSDG